jgi:hypothetical protein
MCATLLPMTFLTKAGVGALVVAMMLFGAVGNVGASTISLPQVVVGYAANTVDGSTFVSLHSSYVQPTVTCSGTVPQEVTFGAGMDGFTGGVIAHAGTGALCRHGTVRYFAWWFNSRRLHVQGRTRFPVAPGDTVQIAFGQDVPMNRFTMTMTIGSNTFTRTVVPGIVGGHNVDCAVVSSPKVAGGAPNFGTQSFDACNAATTSSLTPTGVGVTNAGVWSSSAINDPSRISISAADPDSGAFTATWVAP